MKRNSKSRSRAPEYQDYVEPDWQVRTAPDAAFMGDPAPWPEPEPAVPANGCRSLFSTAATIAAVAAFLGCLGFFFAFILVAKDMPSQEQLESAKVGQSTKIYDRNGGLLFEIFDPNSAAAGRKTNITPDRIPDVLRKATIATEDPNFYSNLGVDPYGVARAVYYDLRYGRTIVGGSTITQQLVKTAVLTPGRTWQRKIHEAILALLVTQRYSKDQILAYYLNAIFYGNLSYGIEAASQSYFNKDVSQLDLAEASLLAGLPQAPALYDPCDNPDAALERQKTVLELMQKQGYVDDAQAQAASAEMEQVLHSEEFSKRCNTSFTIKSPHFVEYVRQQLEQQYGPEVVYKGGLQVYTSLDPALQQISEEEIKKQVSALNKNNVTDGALVAVDPKSGQILAMVGSADFWNKNIDGQVNVATSLRQPGSSIKPINYVTALEKGWTPATPILDITTQFPNGGAPPYVPVNYDGKEHGIVSVRTALANSLNIPAVKTLYFVGVKDMIATAEKMGITSFKDPSRYGLALTLGGGEVRLVELTGAYAIFANGGQRVPLTPYTKIVDGRGQVILDNTKNKPQAQKVLDPRHAYLITNILSDNGARAMSFGANSPLKTSRPSFAKTGTTNDYKDNWTLGGTPELVIGVWVGNARNTAMRGVSGITGAAPIWHNVLERAYAEDETFKGIAPHNFTVPQGLVQATICADSGLLVTDLCPADHRRTEVFVAEQAPKQPDSVWVKLKIDKTNNLLANDSCPADLVEERVFAQLPHDVGDVLPYDQVRAWGNEHGYPAPPEQSSPCTNQPTPEPTQEPISANLVQINAPQDGTTVKGRVRVQGTADVPNMTGYMLEFGPNGQQLMQVGGGNQPVDNGQLGEIASRGVPDGSYIIRLTVFDRDGQTFRDQVRITVRNQEDTPTPEPSPTPTRSPRRTRTPTPTPEQPGAVGPGEYQSNDPAIAYSGSWEERSQLARSSQPGATASLTVMNATSFSIGTVLGPGRGIANVLVDGQIVATFDGFAPTQKSALMGPYMLPDSGVHTISLQVTGDKSPQSKDVIVALERFVVAGGATTWMVPAFSPLRDGTVSVAWWRL